MEPETDIIRQVYCEDGHFLTVRPWVEVPTAVCLQTVGKENQKYFGNYETAMSPKMARELGRALIACADDIDGK